MTGGVEKLGRIDTITWHWKKTPFFHNKKLKFCVNKLCKQTRNK
jgi:hypothetical protein